MSNTLQIQGYAICSGTVTSSSTDQILVTKNYIDSLINSKSKNVGEIRMYAGTTIPTGWLFCNGDPYNADTNPEYAALFDVIGTTYGGTGITNFNIPNLSQKIPIGSTNVNQRYVNYQGSTSVSSGNKTISSDQLPTHTHDMTHSHSFSYIFSTYGTNGKNVGVNSFESENRIVNFGLKFGIVCLLGFTQVTVEKNLLNIQSKILKLRENTLYFK
jgi:microcystin-dependent protein